MSVFSFKTKLHSNKMLVGNAAYDPGGYVPIATVTLASDGTATFSSIPQGYASLQIRYVARTIRASSADNMSMRFNSDSGTNYTSHVMYGYGTGVAAVADVSINLLNVGRVATTQTAANIWGAGTVDIHDYASTTRNKTIRGLSGFDDNTANNGQVWLNSGFWNSTAAVTSITMIGNSASIAAGSTFALYGIKGAA